MPNVQNLTEESYRLIERVEKKKTWFTAIAIACLILAPIGVGLDAYLITVATHQKGGISDLNLVLMVAIGCVSLITIMVGVREYRSVKRLKGMLEQIDLFEETIYNEVLKARMP
jgi:hypothetical protein